MDNMAFGKTMPVADLPEEVTKQKQVKSIPNLDTLIQNNKLNRAIENIISFLDIYNEIFNEAYQDLRFFLDYIKYRNGTKSQKADFHTYIDSLKTTLRDVERIENDLEKVAVKIPEDSIKANELIERLRNEYVRVRTRGIIAIKFMEEFAKDPE